MITLYQRVCPDFPWKDILPIATKDELVSALRLAGYSLSKGAKKAHYISTLDDLMKSSPETFLHGVSWDSLVILQELVRGDSLFVSSPMLYRSRDIQANLITLTYIDETSSTEYLTVCPEVRAALAPVLSYFMEGREAKLHKILDPFIMGLNNLYGLCPMPLVFDYLKEFGLFGSVEGIEIDENVIRGLIWTTPLFSERCVCVHPGAIPPPYSESKEQIEYLESPSRTYVDFSNKEFFDCLQLKGVLFQDYRKFSEAEILAAGHITPEFIFPEAVKFKECLCRSGWSPDGASSEIYRKWLSAQSTFKKGEDKLSVDYVSKDLTSAGNEFMANVPLWSDFGYSINPPDEAFDKHYNEMQSIFEQKKHELDELEKQEFPGFLPALTKFPVIRPEKGKAMCSRLIPHNGAEFTIDTGDGKFFVCYAIAEQGTEKVGLYACWKRCFDAPLERFMTLAGINPTDGFLRKYKVFGRLLMNSDKPSKTDNIRISLVSIEERQKEWYVCNRISNLDWVEVVIIGADQHPILEKEVLTFYKENMRLYHEIESSDSKSFKAALHQLWEGEKIKD